MSQWTHSICERCWIQREGAFDVHGNLKSVRKPVHVVDPMIETCCYCFRPR